MYSNQEDKNTGVMDDVNDLDEGFGYYRPIMDEQEAQGAEPGEAPRKRGRPPKDPTSAMSDAQKADRMAMILLALDRYKASKETP
jgi:hypothetical protein